MRCSYGSCSKPQPAISGRLGSERILFDPYQLLFGLPDESFPAAGPCHALTTHFPVSWLRCKLLCVVVEKKDTIFTGYLDAEGSPLIKQKPTNFCLWIEVLGELELHVLEYLSTRQILKSGIFTQHIHQILTVQTWQKKFYQSPFSPFDDVPRFPPRCRMQ